MSLNSDNIKQYTVDIINFISGLEEVKTPEDVLKMVLAVFTVVLATSNKKLVSKQKTEVRKLVFSAMKKFNDNPKIKNHEKEASNDGK